MPKFKIGDYVQDTLDGGYHPLFGTVCERPTKKTGNAYGYAIDVSASNDYWVARFKKEKSTFYVEEGGLKLAEKPSVRQAADSADYYAAITGE